MLQAGAAARDITPAQPMHLGGYLPTREWTTIHDALSTRALAVSDAGTTVVFIAVDSVGIVQDLANRIRAGVQSLTGVPAAHVFVAATHSHSTPDTVGLYGGCTPDYPARLVVQSAAAAQAAVNALVPARVRWTQVDVPPVTMNRRIPTGALDPQCTVLQVAALDDTPIATFTNLAAHAVCLGPDNQAVTADFIHYLRTRLEAAFGGVAVHTNGTEGNVNPAPQLHAGDRLDRTGGTFAMAEQMGHAIAEALIPAVAAAPWRTEAPLEVRTGSATIPIENPVFLQAIEAGLVTRELEAGATGAPVGFVQLGDVRFVMVPGEAFAEIGLQIKAWWPDAPVGVIGLCNDLVGYLIPPDLFDLSDYEESVSPSRDAWPALERDLRALVGIPPAASMAG